MLPAGLTVLAWCSSGLVLSVGALGWICRVDAQHTSLQFVDELHRDGLRGLFSCLQLLVESKALAHERFVLASDHVHGSTSLEACFNVI